VHGLLELLDVKGFGVVVIGNLELPADSSNTSGTSGGNLLSDVFEELCLGGILGDAYFLSCCSLGLGSAEDVVVLLGSWLSARR